MHIIIQQQNRVIVTMALAQQCDCEKRYKTCLTTFGPLHSPSPSKKSRTFHEKNFLQHTLASGLGQGWEAVLFENILSSMTST